MYCGGVLAIGSVRQIVDIAVRSYTFVGFYIMV